MRIFEYFANKDSGKGKKTLVRWTSKLGESTTIRCLKCRGIGNVDGDKCDLCDGHKYVEIMVVRPDPSVEKLVGVLSGD